MKLEKREKRRPIERAICKGDALLKGSMVGMKPPGLYNKRGLLTLLNLESKRREATQ